MTVIYYEEDADATILRDKTIGIIGYGNRGRLAALNLRHNGLAVLATGTDEDQIAAQGDGFRVGIIRNVVQQADIILLMMPDEAMTQVYMEHIAPNLKKGNTLIFSNAYNVAFGFIEPPPFVDVGMVAPRIAGGEPWKNQLLDEGILSYVAVWQDVSRNTWQTTLAIALTIGSLKNGALEINIEQEAEITLFIQQALLPVFHHLMTSASELLIRQGYPPEAVITDLYLSGKFTSYIQQVAQSGFLQTLQRSPKPSLYGTLSRLDRFNDLKLDRLMEVTLDEIRSGEFAREWSQEHADGHPRLNKLLKHQQALDLWEMEQQTLDMLGNNDAEIL